MKICFLAFDDYRFSFKSITNAANACDSPLEVSHVHGVCGTEG